MLLVYAGSDLISQKLWNMSFKLTSPGWRFTKCVGRGVISFHNLLTVFIWCPLITDKAKAFPWLTGHDWGVGALADAGVDGEALFLVLEKNSVIWQHPEKTRNDFVTGTNFVRRCSWILVSPCKCWELAVIAHQICCVLIAQVRYA